MTRVIIDHGRCDGTRHCVRVCPEGVFALLPVDLDERRWLLRLRLRLTGGKQAFAVNEDACTACGKCIAACPESAVAVVAG